MTSRQPPQARPVTERAGPCQLHGSVGSLSPAKAPGRAGRPSHADVLGLARFGDLERLAREQSAAQRPGVHIVHAGSRTQVDLGGSAAEARDAVRREPVMEVGVVAGAQERFGVGPGQRGV